MRWPLAFFGSEFVVILAFWALSGVLSLWPITLAVLALFALPAWLAALLGTRAWRARQRPAASA